VFIIAKKQIIGYVYDSPKLEKEDKLFLKLAKKKNIELLMFNFSKELDEDDFEKKVKLCDLVYNSTGEDFVIEILKTIEELGKTVIDNSKLFYYTEDKWMFYLKCKEHHIPTIKTILLPNNLSSIKHELKKLNEWPLVIKRVYGTMGEFVEKADNLNQTVKIVKRFWKKDCDHLPIIAQEFITSYSYRVTVIGKKIVQTAIKKGNGWKNTGVYGKKFEKFKVDKKLKKIIDKVIKVTKINICGIDLLKKGKDWLVLEVNTDPGLDFIESEYESMVGKVLDFLKVYDKTHKLISGKTS